MDSRVSSSPFSLLRQDPPRPAGNGAASFRPPTRSSMTLGSDPAPFHMLPEGESRLGRFGAGFLIEMIVLFLLIVIPLLIPDKMTLVTKYWSMPIAAPPVTPFKPQPPKPVDRPKIVPKEVVKEIPKPEIVVPPKPRIQTPVFTSPVAKPATAKKNTPTPDAPEVAKVMPPTLTPGNVGTGSSAIPTLKKPRELVQTGGFGDPNGVPVSTNGNSSHAANINHLGAFDLPPGPGYGNGTGGTKGARGVVSSGGFGNGVGTGAVGGGGGGKKVVESSGFSQVAAAPTPKAQQTIASPVATQVEITYKPRPAYTDEAKSLKIEGDVLISVNFTASGQVQVERVVKGLGHGLDESAMAAARQIRFKPAKTADGQPVDSQAVVHILFELAF
jgi:TonB family protein